jgi:hypothetical protein
MPRASLGLALLALTVLQSNRTVALAAEATREVESAMARIAAAIRLIGATSAGDELLERARALWGDRPEAWLEQGMIREGRVSRTDATLTRSWDASTGVEFREREVVVHLKLDQPLQEISLDLAHELTHAVVQPAWDPYDPELRVENYVRTAIEGPGGEVDAILRECRAAFELEAAGKVAISRCDRYRNSYQANGRISREQVTRDFYASGKSFEKVPESVRRRIPEISMDDPIYFSSTGETPYPLVLVREYETLNEVACSNTRSRLLRQAGALRADAEDMTASEPGTDPALVRAQEFLIKRCR